MFDERAGRVASSRGVSNIQWTQQLPAGMILHVGAESAVSNERYSLGLEVPAAGGRLGVDSSISRGRQGLRDDTSLRLSYSRPLGQAAAAATRSPGAPAIHSLPQWPSLLEEASRRPQGLPRNLLARIDASAAPTRLLAINKAALPAGSTIDPATGTLRIPLGVAVSGVAGVTLNGSSFVVPGPFAVAGSHLLITPLLLAPPAEGAQDTYVVTASNSDGGTTLITVVVSRGSVRIDRIEVRPGPVLTPLLEGFAALTKTYGDAAFDLAAPRSPSAGAFTFSSSNPAVARIDGTRVTLTGVGVATLTAAQAATQGYASARIDAVLTVTPKPPALEGFGAITKQRSDAPFTITEPRSDSPGAFTYSSSNPAVATVSGTTVTITGAGSAALVAQQAATGNFAAGSVSATLTVEGAAPILGSFSAVTKNYGDPPFALVPPTSPSAGAFSFTSSNPAVATVNGTTVTLTGAGTTTLTATQAAEGGYFSATATATLSVAAVAPTLAGFPSINKSFGNAPFALATPSSNSAGQFTFSSNNAAVATVSGHTVTIVGVGQATLTATQAAAGPYMAGSISASLEVAAAAPTLIGFANLTKTFGDAAFLLTPPSSNSPGAFTFTSSNPAVATVNGSTVTLTGTGTTTLIATQAAAGGHLGTTTNATLTVLPGTPSLAGFGALTRNLGDASFTLTAPSSNSAGSFSYTSSHPAVATINGATVTLVGAGSTVIRATQAAAGGYGPGSLDATLTVNPMVPSYGSFTPLARNYGDAPFTLTAPSSTSPAPFAYTSSNTAVATVSGSQVSIVGVGSTTITAAQGPSGAYGAGSTSALLVVGPAPASLGGFGPFTKTAGDPDALITAPSSNSVGAFTYTSSDPAVATVSGATLRIVGVGTTTLTATQAAAGNYSGASVSGTLTVLAATPALSGFGSVTKTYGDAAFTLSAPSSPSAGGFSYTSSNTTVATVSGATVTLVGAGTATLTATQAAAGNYATASTSMTLTVQPAAPTLGSFASIAKTYGDAAFALSAPSSNSGGSFTYASSNTSVATVSGNTVTIVGAGSVTLTATQAAAGNYLGGSVATALTVAKATPTLGAIPDMSFTTEQHNTLCISTVEYSCFTPEQRFVPYSVDFGPALNGTTVAADLGLVPGGLGRNGLRNGDTLTSSDPRILADTAQSRTGPSLSLMSGVTFSFPGWPGSSAPIVSTMTLTRAATANFNAASVSFTLTVTPTSGTGPNYCLNAGLMTVVGGGVQQCQCTPTYTGDRCELPALD